MEPGGPRQIGNPPEIQWIECSSDTCIHPVPKCRPIWQPPADVIVSDKRKKARTKSRIRNKQITQGISLVLSSYYRLALASAFCWFETSRCVPFPFPPWRSRNFNVAVTSSPYSSVGATGVVVKLHENPPRTLDREVDQGKWHRGGRDTKWSSMGFIFDEAVQTRCSHSRGLDHKCVDPMAPAVKSTVFAVPASRIVRLVLRTPMTVDALGIRAVHLVVARRHPCDFPQDVAFSFGQGIGVGVGAVVRRAI